MKLRRALRLTFYWTVVALLSLLLVAVATADDSQSSGPASKESPDTPPTAVPDEQALPHKRILFVLMCQSRRVAYHRERCSQLQQHIEAQQAAVVETAKASPIAIALADDLVDAGVETFFYLPLFIKNHTSLSQADFVFFCHEETRLNLAGLMGLLDGYNASEPVFLGSPLQDQGFYIIHHFSLSRHLYPFVYSGFAMSRALVASLTQHIHADRAKSEEYEFRIDPAYELASLISIDFRIANLTPVDAMCAKIAEQEEATPPTYSTVAKGDDQQAQEATAACVTWTTASFRLPECAANKSRRPLLERTLFAVKTHKANFDTVLSVLRDTWAHDAPHIRYYADVDEPSIPALACGVPNTERGHCDKLNRILHLILLPDPAVNSSSSSINDHGDAASPEAAVPAANNSESGYDWFVIADDDTLLSVPRLLRLLACYDTAEAIDSSSNAPPLAVGEKYGYLSGNGLQGYAYPTGGSSFALNAAAVRRLVQPAAQARCGSAESPDDMSLGLWLRGIAAPLLHSHLLHQARPMDYPPALLAAQLPASFHKHYDLDPRRVYREWLGGGDRGPLGDVAKAEEAVAKEGEDQAVAKEEL